MKEANEESRTTIAAVREEAIINVLEPLKANIDKEQAHETFEAPETKCRAEKQSERARNRNMLTI